MAPILSILVLALSAVYGECLPTSPCGLEDVVYPLIQERISSSFGIRSDPISHNTRRHFGMDLVAVEKAEVHSIAEGLVIYAGSFGGYGSMVSILHKGGYSSHYAHLSSVLTSVGDRVTAGALIGISGATGRATGEHLHFEIRRDGCPVNPLTVLTSLGKSALG